jgi:hypothetical protein
MAPDNIASVALVGRVGSVHCEVPKTLTWERFTKWFENVLIAGDFCLDTGEGAREFIGVYMYLTSSCLPSSLRLCSSLRHSKCST